MVTPDPPPDDPDIADGWTLLRRIHPKWIIPDPPSQSRLASGAFQDLVDDSGTRAMSVFVEERLLELGYTGADLVTGHGGFGLAAFPARLARECGLTISWSPAVVEGPKGDAHAHLFGNKTGSVQKRLRDGSVRRIWPVEDQSII